MLLESEIQHYLFQMKYRGHNENYETLGGLIVNSTEEIPAQNEQVKIESYLFTILEVSNTKIDLVSLNILDEE